MKNGDELHRKCGVRPADDFRRCKLTLALAIMAVGMVLALIAAAIEGWGLHRPYPSNTILFTPVDRFNDFSDMLADASRSNPYLDPFGLYLPLAWVVFRAFAMLPYLFSLTLFLYLGSAGLYLVLVAALRDTVKTPWPRILAALGLLALSYPVLITLDRANLEILLAGLVAAAVYFFGRARYGLGTLFLILGAGLKLYPALLAVLLLRQRRVGWLAIAALGFLASICLSFAVLNLPMETGFTYYARNLVFLKQAYILENYAIEGCASLWNVYKLALITAAHLGLMPPVDFSYDRSFIAQSYTVYSVLMALLAAGLAVHVCLVEKEFLRCAAVLLLYLSISTPLGADYRLLYANIALIALVVLKTRRPYDLTTIVLLALVMVPKKEIFLTYAGHTESNTADVSIQAVLNPLLVTAALAFLVHDGVRLYDPGWTRVRWRRLLRSLLPAQIRQPASTPGTPR